MPERPGSIQSRIDRSGTLFAQPRLGLVAAPDGLDPIALRFEIVAQQLVSGASSSTIRMRAAIVGVSAAREAARRRRR